MKHHPICYSYLEDCHPFVVGLCDYKVKKKITAIINNYSSSLNGL